MRLIDADRLKQEIATIMPSRVEVNLVVDAQPDAIVRCKDCKYYDHFNGCMSWHDVNSNNDNWYCADGERN